MSCKSGKRGYSTKSIAKGIAKRSLQSGLKMRPYRCDECGNFHLTSLDSKSIEYFRGNRSNTRSYE